MVDALLPFTEELESAIGSGLGLAEAWRSAAATATASAHATRNLRPKVGRARPLADKSIGTPDAGATSTALIVTAVGELLAQHETQKEPQHG